MKVAVPKQRGEGETRCAITPAVVKKLVKLGLTVTVEENLGAGAHLPNEQYASAGATVASASPSFWSDADLVLTLEPPTPTDAQQLKPGAVLVGMLSPLGQRDLIATLCAQNVTSFSMEFLPRISRAQSMDVLSSQANLAGYKAVLLGGNTCAKMFPMMITAAGTIAPAKVFVVGAGVAGLQAIATAKRLGAIVEAFDVRSVTKEQVQSLGARFVELSTAEQDDAATGGYAKQQSEEEQRKQSALMSKHVIGADLTITTAAVFGKAPPMLIPGSVVEQMHAGSVIVDMAANSEHGRGNCELTRPGDVFTADNGVTLIGHTNLPALLPTNASQVYANNMFAFCQELLDAEGQLQLNLEDEIQSGAIITHDGQIVNERIASATS